jgi:hypothetical protein
MFLSAAQEINALIASYASRASCASYASSLHESVRECVRERERKKSNKTNQRKANE